MIQVPDEIKWLCEQDSISKNIRVKFVNGEFPDLVNADIVSESVIFTESVISSDGIKFGLFEGNIIEFETFFLTNFRHTEIFVQIEIDISSLDSDFINQYGSTSSDVSFPYYSIPYGYFYVDSCKKSATSNTQKVVGYQNKYKDTVTGKTSTDLVKLTTFEKMKFYSTASSDTYNFNHLLAYASSLNDAEFILDETVPRIPQSQGETCQIQVYNDPWVYTSYSNTKGGAAFIERDAIRFNDIVDHTTMGHIEYTVKDTSDLHTVNKVSLDMEGICLAFTNLDYLNKCPGSVVTPSSHGPQALNYSCPPTYIYSDSIFEFNWNYTNSSGVSKVVERIVRRLNNDLADIDPALSNAISVKDIEQYFYPSATYLGFVPQAFTSSSTASTTYYSVEENNKPIPLKEVSLEDEKLIISPNVDGVTDYTGKSISGKNGVFPIDGSKLGCVGYTIFIPCTCYAYITPSGSSTPELSYSQSFIEEYEEDTDTPVTLKLYSLEYLPLAQDVERTKKKVTATSSYWGWSGNKSANLYDAISFIKDFSLQTTFNAMLEIAGSFVKIDRQTNKPKYVNFALMDSLYPADDLYPASNIYPTDSDYRISRTIWRSVWYEDTLYQKYNRVIITLSDDSDEQQLIYYEIIPDSEIVDTKEFSEYDLSSNYFIQNKLLISQAQQIVDKVGETLKSIQYYPATIDIRALPYLEAADPIIIITETGSFYTYILRHRISGIHAIMDNIESR